MKAENNVNRKTRKLVVIAMMIAVVEILSFSPLGMVPLPFASATTVHIPVILTALLEGPLAGMAVGLAMGVTSIMRALTSPASPLDPLFANPLISVLPRLLIPLISFFSYKLFNLIISGFFSKGNIVSCFLAGALGSMTNTIGCLGMLYILYAKKIVEQLMAASGGQIVTAETFIFAIISTSGIAEMLVAAFLTALLVPILKKTFYR